jgi:hypothetical protein
MQAVGLKFIRSQSRLHLLPMNQLVLRPLSRLEADSPQSPLILVIDALDDCEDDNDIQRILELLAEARRLRTVRVFMTSRPEIPIRQAEHQDFVLHNISPSVIEHDISISLEYNLGIIRRKRTLASDWPGEQTIKRLV